MNVNFFNTVKRTFKTNKVSTVLNIAGLSIGLASCILLLLYVQHELSYDNFHADGKNICRVINVSSRNDQKFSTTPYILASTFNSSIPEIEEYTHVQFIGNETSFIVSGDMEFNEKKIIETDSSFFKIFSFEYLRGEAPEKVLSSTDKILISESTSKKYFGNDDGIGKTLAYKAPYSGETVYTVAGIYKDFPPNSHIQADFIFPNERMVQQYGDWMLANWGSNSYCTYFKLTPNSSIAEVASKIPSVLETHAGTIDANRADLHKSLNYILQPLSEIHLFSTDISDSDTVKKGNYSRLVIFGVIAVLILVVAFVNFILLSLSGTNKKLKNIAIRKISGASVLSLIKQGNYEFLGVFIISLIVSSFLVAACLPVFQKFVGEGIIPGRLPGYVFLLLFILFSFFLGTIASGYISIILAKNDTIRIVRDRLTPSTSSQFFRKSLVTFQIAIFIVLLASSLYINKQLNYINQKDLGFDKESLLTLRFDGDMNSFATFKQELIKDPVVINATGSTTSPVSGGSWRGNLKIDEKDIDESMEVVFTDADFLETYKMELVEGRFFSDDLSSDKTDAIVINETAARDLGLGNQTIGYNVDWSGFVSGNKKIVGIVKDFNMRSLYETIEPLAFLMNTNQMVADASIRVRPGAISGTVNSIRSVWNNIYPEKPFVIAFADQELEKAYKAETTTSAIIDAFTILAVLVSCLGFFGMSLMAAQQKTKEIGIRKVNGAKVSEILAMLNKDFVKWVVIAFVIATPIAWYATDQWLENFAYKTSLSWWIFVLAGVMALGIALLTVSWQSWRAATRNPVEALRYE